MTSPAFATFALCVAGAALAVAAGQTPAAVTPKTAVVIGQVIDGSSKAPIGGARISLYSGERRENVLCDEQGRFAFSDLAAGAVTVIASKSGYVGGKFGQRYPNDVEQPLDLAAGERLTDLRLPLWKFATISGLVEDGHGDALIGLTVRAFKRDFVAGAFRLTTDMTTVTLGTTTDDRGAYRLSVAPGEYAIGIPSSDRQRRSPSVTEATAFAATFFPSTLSPSLATVLTVASGEERAGVNLQVVTEAARKISGTIVGAESVTTPFQLHLVRADAMDVSTDLYAATTASASDRTFTFANVAPGSYVIRTVKAPIAPGTPIFTFGFGTSGFSFGTGEVPWMLGNPLPPLQDEPSWWADLPVVVGEVDPTGLAMTLQPGVRMRGRLQFDGQSEKPTPEQIAASVMLLVPVDGRERTARPGRVDGEGRFETASIPPGRYEMRSIVQFRNWLLASMTVKGRDVLHHPFDIGPEGVDDVVIRLTDAKMSEISGVVSAADGRPRTDVSIYIFPSDRTEWTAPIEQDLREIRPGRSGEFHAALVPGREYFFAAVAGSVPQYWKRPEYLESLVARATKVQLAPGEKRVVNLVVQSR